MAVESDCTGIGKDAFSQSDALARVVAGDGLTSIGVCAFDCCSVIASLELPSSVRSKGKDGFSVCRLLTAVTVSEDCQTYRDAFGQYSPQGTLF
jgi:hypothetical protein